MNEHSIKAIISHLSFSRSLHLFPFRFDSHSNDLFIFFINSNRRDFCLIIVHWPCTYFLIVSFFFSSRSALIIIAAAAAIASLWFIEHRHSVENKWSEEWIDRFHCHLKNKSSSLQSSRAWQEREEKKAKEFLKEKKLIKVPLLLFSECLENLPKEENDAFRSARRPSPRLISPLFYWKWSIRND